MNAADGRVAEQMADGPTRPDRSAYETFVRTGRYPLDPAVSARCTVVVERRRQYLAVESAMGGDS